MKRLSLFAAVALVLAISAAASLRDSGPATAAVQPFSTSYDIGLSGTGAGTSPDLQVALKLDNACAGLLCTTAPTSPFFDIAITTYRSKVVAGVAGTGGGIESGGNCLIATGIACTTPGAANIGAKVGSNTFQINTNQGANAGTGNINTLTGSAPRCQAPPATTQLSATFDILYGAVTGTTVSGRDGPDADDLPDTQADVNPANGIPDGADKVPDYIATLLGSSQALLKSRGYGIAVIIPGVATVDVNFLTLDLTAFGQGYAAVTTLGNTDVAYEPAGSQTSLTCTPFISTTNTFGVSVANGPAVGGQTLRVISGTAGDSIPYALLVSATEDYDNDGAPTGLDRCPLTAQATAALAMVDSDDDGIGDDCDPASGTPDNTADGFTAPYPTDNVVCTAGQVGEGLPSKGRGEWHTACSGSPVSDQDIDGDGVLNFSDNCVATFNRTQTDSDGDNVGNACDANFKSVHAPIDAQFPTAASTTRDARSGGAQGLPIGTDFPGATCAPITTCNIPAGGSRDGNEGGGDLLWNDIIIVGAAEGNMPLGNVAGADATPPSSTPVFDSNDDGFPDSLPAGGGLPAVDDINSDADFDGCSDSYERRGGCQGDPLDPDVNNNGIIDGAEDLSPGNGTKDWIDDVNGAVIAGALVHTTGNSPNSQGSPDSDNDGCSNRREAQTGAGAQLVGGLRDALNPYDFADMFVANNSAPAAKNKKVQPGDALATNFYAGGVNATTPNTVGTSPTSMLVTYGGSGASFTTPGDSNNDGVSNGAQYDRVANGPISKAGNGAINGQDALTTNNQASGANGPADCSAGP